MVKQLQVKVGRVTHSATPPHRYHSLAVAFWMGYKYLKRRSQPYWWWCTSSLLCFSWKVRGEARQTLKTFLAREGRQTRTVIRGRTIKCEPCPSLSRKRYYNEALSTSQDDKIIKNQSKNATADSELELFHTQCGIQERGFTAVSWVIFV